MRSLSNLDASFLHLETPRTPMHLAGIFIFSDTPAQRMTAARFRQHLRGRVNKYRILRERLVVSPLGLGQAWWAEDPEFDLENHLRFAESEAPLSQTSLAPIANAFLDPLLNRDSPLWEVMFVSERDVDTTPDDDTLTNNNAATRFAVLLKVHHAACDGLSAKHLITSLFDGLQPDDDGEAAGDNNDNAGTPAGLPTSLALLADNVRAARRLGHKTSQLATHLVHCLKQSVALRLQTTQKQPMFYGAPPSPFNIAIDSRRLRLNVELSLPLLKTIRQAQPDVTINDIVLTLCGAALRRYMAEIPAKPLPSLTAFAPISKRENDQHSDGGNQVSGMLIGLGTDIDDALERLHTVRANALRAKRFNAGTAYEKLLDYVPGTAMSLFLRSYANVKLGNALPPVFNVVITNIASLPATLHLSGAMLESVATFAPIHDAMALTIVVLTHKNTTTLGITSTPDAIVDPERFSSCLLQAQDELVAAAKAATSEASRTLIPQKLPMRPVLPEQVLTKTGASRQIA